MISWNKIEAVYVDQFTSDCGVVIKSIMYGTWCSLDSKVFGFTYSKLVEQICENPYYPYFIILFGFNLE